MRQASTSTGSVQRSSGSTGSMQQSRSAAFSATAPIQRRTRSRSHGTSVDDRAAAIPDEVDSSAEEVEVDYVNDEPDNREFDNWWAKKVKHLKIDYVHADASLYIERFSRWAYLEGRSEKRAATNRHDKDNAEYTMARKLSAIRTLCVISRDTCSPSPRIQSLLTSVKGRTDLDAVAQQKPEYTMWHPHSCSACQPSVDFNWNQSQAIDHAMGRTASLIQGPPGTGKTSVAVHIVVGWAFSPEIRRQFRNSIFAILAVCESNTAVDTYCRVLSTMAWKWFAAAI